MIKQYLIVTDNSLVPSSAPLYRPSVPLEKPPAPPPIINLSNGGLPLIVTIIIIIIKIINNNNNNHYNTWLVLLFLMDVVKHIDADESIRFHSLNS